MFLFALNQGGGDVGGDEVLVGLRKLHGQVHLSHVEGEVLLPEFEDEFEAMKGVLEFPPIE